jgi:hypothetical protein
VEAKIPKEDEQLLRDFLTPGFRWKFLNKPSEVRTQGQLKSRWYSGARHRLHGHIANHRQLAHTLGQSCLGLPVAQLFLP